MPRAHLCDTMDEPKTAALPHLAALLTTLHESTARANNTLTHVESLTNKTRQLVKKSREQISSSDQFIHRMELCCLKDRD